LSAKKRCKIVKTKKKRKRKADLWYAHNINKQELDANVGRNPLLDDWTHRRQMIRDRHTPGLFTSLRWFTKQETYM
jgi:hypothetical protein